MTTTQPAWQTLGTQDEAAPSDQAEPQTATFPGSSWLASAEYDPSAGGLLTVTFLKGGVKTYEGVRQDEFDALQRAPSAGRYLLDVIIPAYD